MCPLKGVAHLQLLKPYQPLCCLRQRSFLWLTGNLCNRRKASGASAWLAGLGAVLASALGLLASWVLDAPSGACVALALSVFGALSAGFRNLPTAKSNMKSAGSS
jgi:hypothetical protein